MDSQLGKTGIDTAYEESLLRSEPVFRRFIPTSHALVPQEEDIDQIARAEDLSLTNTLLGYQEVIRITTEYQSFILKRLSSDRVTKAPLNQMEGWLTSIGMTLEADEWLYGLIEMMKERAVRSLAELRKQFLIDDSKLISDIEQGEQASLNEWRALLGITTVDGHLAEEPEVDLEKLASYAGLHRQIADLGISHINRVEDMLDVLEIVEQDSISPEASVLDGASYLATFLANVSPSAALAQITSIYQKRKVEMIQLLKGMKQVSMDRISAVHEHQDQSFRLRNSYETSLMNPLMEMEEGVSEAFDDFASMLMESATDASEASGQAHASLIQLFKTEYAQFGKLFSKVLDLTQGAKYVHILADLVQNQAKDAQDVESRLIRQAERP